MFRRILLSGILILLTAPAASAQPVPRVVVVPLSGVTWSDVAQNETLSALAREGASATVSVRTARGRSTDARGMLTFGAGQRAYVPTTGESDLAFSVGERYLGMTARAAFFQRTGLEPSGEGVHIGIPELVESQESTDYGAVPGALTDALHEAGRSVAVVSAGDTAISPEPEQMRRSAALAVIDSSGQIDHARFEGMLKTSPRRPWGVTVDSEGFISNVRDALGKAEFIVADPGELSRAREFGGLATAERGNELTLTALDTTAGIVSGIRELLEPDDVLMLVGVSAIAATDRDELVPVIAVSDRFEASSLLESPTTRQPGIIALTDLAPTVASILGGERSDAMGGRDVFASTTVSDPVTHLDTLADESLFAAQFSLSVYYTFVVGVVLLTILALLAFRFEHLPSRRFAGLLARAVIAFPLAALVTGGGWLAGTSQVGAHLIVWTVTFGIALVSLLIPGPRWGSAVAILLATCAAYAFDLVVLGGTQQLNGIFGASPVVGGRFYGLVNSAFSLLLGAAVLGFCGLAELRKSRRLPWWGIAGLLGVVALIGLPGWGANFGGLLTAVVTVGVVTRLSYAGRLDLRSLVIAGGAAVALAAAVSFADSLRDVESQTHVGRLADDLLAGGFGEFWLIINRKLGAAFASLKFTRWTYAIPVIIAVLAVLLHRPTGPLADELPRLKTIRAGLWSLLVAGVVGFAVNDSGIVIPATLVAVVVPFLILLAVDRVSPR